MHASLMTQCLLGYGPLVLAALGVAAYSYYTRRPPAPPTAPATVPGLTQLLDCVDDFALEYMRDPQAIRLGDATRAAFLNVATAKSIIRRTAARPSC